MEARNSGGNNDASTENNVASLDHWESRNLPPVLPGRQRHAKQHAIAVPSAAVVGRDNAMSEGLAMSASPPILLQKSFSGDERNFLGPLMRFVCGDVRDLIVSYKNDHGPSYRRYRALHGRGV